MALTYFLCVRVVQDQKECARSVWFREEWGKETRGEATHLCHETLEGRSFTINAAYQASAHQLADFTVLTRTSS